jgi:U4/U6 small nuclear ribonucleoprotein PRP3
MPSTVPSKRPAPVDIEEARRRVQERAAAINARIQQNLSGSAQAAPQPAQHGSQNGAPAPVNMADLKAKIAALQAKNKASATPPPPPVAAFTPPPPREPAYPPPPVRNDSARMDFPAGARGGLSAPIHPVLSGLGDSQEKKDTKGGKGWKSVSEKAKTEDNPYLSEEKVTSGRARRALVFNHNMHSRPAMVAANELRRKQAMETMKKRIQEQTTRVGIDDSAEQEAFVVSMPPDLDYWDEILASDPNLHTLTSYIHHPILIEPPQSKLEKPVVKMMLTTKEMRKMRRMRRGEVHKEEQAKIRLGLVPAPAPKIKHSNVMRVYGEMAVQDPTAVEAMVNKQVAERKNAHLQANAGRQLTKEEKLEKTKTKALADSQKGLFISVYVILSKVLLGKHRYLIDINAKECHDLTGFAMITPNFTLVIAIAGDHSTRAIKKLLVGSVDGYPRIKWQGLIESNGEPLLNPEYWKEHEDNTCVLLHQGQIRERKFKKWGGLREVNTEQDARKVLSGAKLENFWTQAKSLAKEKEKEKEFPGA